MKKKIEAVAPKVQRKRPTVKPVRCKCVKLKPLFHSVREAGPVYDVACSPPAARLSVYVPVRCIPFDKPVNRPKDAARIANTVCGASVLSVEGVFCAYLNTKNRPLDICCVAIGGIDSCVVPTVSIFHGAICCGASSLILYHNHPSGNATPSDLDIQLTRNIIAAGKIMDIKMLDHIILANDGYISIRESNVIDSW